MKTVRHSIVIAACFSAQLFGCATRPQPTNEVRGLTAQEMTAAVEKKTTVATPDIKSGIKFFASGEYLQASRSFSRALKYDPRNAGLHFLNALCYHMLVEQGDTSKSELAEIGYGMAMEFDPSNPWPARYLGHLRMSQKKFSEARDLFAKSLQIDKDSPELLLSMASAAYYAQDLNTANSAITQAEKLDPRNPRVMSAAAMIHAAAGEFDKSAKAIASYANSPKADADKTKFLNGRLKDWQDAYQSARTPAAEPPVAASVLPAAANHAPPGPPPRMVSIDVVIIRSEELNTASKGVNLLSGLQLQFTGSSARTNALTSGATGDVTSNTLASTITVPAVTYNLNIFNDNESHHEVLARPTLVSMDGKPSTFFSGDNLQVALEGGVGTQNQIQAIPIGVNLAVTPQFLNDDTVTLSVDAGRDFVEQANSLQTFTKYIQTSKNKVNVNVVMKFDETLIVSGLSEKESQKVKDGVPFLQSIPILQYLFSNERRSIFRAPF